MKCKLGVVVATIGLTSSALLAQGEVTTGAAGINAPASALSFKPYLTIGAHGYQEMQAKSGSYTAGPYTAPGFESTYKNSDVSVGLQYEAEIGSSRGFGEVADKNFSANTYIQHHPALVVSGGSPTWKFNGTIDAVFTLNNEALKLNENKSDINFMAGVEYAITPTLSVTADSWVQRVSYFDTANLDNAYINNVNAKNSTDASTVAEKAIVSGAKTAINSASVGQEPSTTLYSGALGIKKSITESLKLTTYVRAGHVNANYVGGSGYAYRFHAHLDFPTPLAKLSGFTRYRMNVTDVKGGEISYQNYNLSQLSYAVTTNWSIIAQNELAITQDTTGAGKAVKIQNENYVGATYKF
jgi:hypothetical protein